MLNEVFIGKCPACGGACALREPLCPDCVSALKTAACYCHACGFPLVAKGAFCPSCSGKINFSAGRVFACYKYTGAVRKLLLGIKFKYNFRSALTMHRVLGLPAGLDMTAYDAIVPVPSHPLRRLRRFFHPAELAAGYLAKTSGVPVVKALYRKRNTVFQYRLKATARKQNVSGAFGIRTKEKFKNVILVDDIFTTGSTLNECAKLLKTAGASWVDCYVIAVD